MTAIVQARMGSSRLPGKVMKEVCGKPLIGHMIYRLGFAQKLEKVVVAVPDDERGGPLARYVQSLGIDVFFGSELDVLARYYFAAKQHDARHVMRLTADCPLMDPCLVDAITERYLQQQPDYMRTGMRFAEGLGIEIFRFEAIEKSYREARLRSEREHVTQYIQKHPEFFKLSVFENETDDSRMRLTVDEPQDFEVLKFVFQELAPDGNEVFSIVDVKRLLENNKNIAALNASIIRGEGLIKSLREDGVADFIQSEQNG